MQSHQTRRVLAAIDAALSKSGEEREAALGEAKRLQREATEAETAERNPEHNMPDQNELTDAKIAASEARTDSKFARLEGQITNLSTDLSAKMTAVVKAVEGFDKKLTEQRTDLDKKLTEQRTDLDKKLAEQRSDFKTDFRAVRTLTISVGVSLAALMLAVVIAVFSVGNTMFSRGMSVRDVVKAVIHEQQQPPAKFP